MKEILARAQKPGNSRVSSVSPETPLVAGRWSGRGHCREWSHRSEGCQRKGKGEAGSPCTEMGRAGCERWGQARYPGISRGGFWARRRRLAPINFLEQNSKKERCIEEGTGNQRKKREFKELRSRPLPHVVEHERPLAMTIWVFER